MARLSTTGSVSTDTTTINLTRLLTRLQKTVLKPDNAAEQRLRTSIYERNKVATVGLGCAGAMQFFNANNVFSRILTMLKHYCFD